MKSKYVSDIAASRPTAQTSRAAALGAMLSIVISPAAWGQDASSGKSDFGPLTLTGGITQTVNSNPLQVPTGSTAPLPQGRSSASDQITSSTLGLNLNTTQGVQKFTVVANVVDNRYQNFDSLNYTATNYDATWNWYVAPELTGTLGTKRAETLNTLANYSGNSLNRQVTTGTNASVAYVLQGAWRAVAGLAQNKSVNDQALLGVNDFQSTTANYGLQYAMASGSSVTLSNGLTSGSYINLVPQNSAFTDSSYSENAVTLALHWAVSEMRTADFFVTNLSRSHPTYSSRDFSGANYGANISWQLSGKINLAGGLTHTLGEFQTANTNYSATDTLSLGPMWIVSPKFSLGLAGQWAVVNYGGVPNAVAASNRTDNINALSLTANWQVSRNWALVGIVQRASRSSNVAGIAYDASGAAVTVNFIF